MVLILPNHARDQAHAVAYLKGNQAFTEGRWNDAIQAYTEALQCREDADTLTNLGAIYQQNWKLGSAVQMYQRALQLDPWQIQAMGNLANALQDMLRPEEGLALKRRAVELHPPGQRKALLQAHAELVFTCTTLMAFADFAAEMRQFVAQQLAHTFSRRPPLRALGVSGRKIRLGYLSADFNRHTVMTLLEPLFRNFDVERFDLFLYSNGDASKTDDRTRELMTLGHWRDISERNDRQARNLMQLDKLDLLVDLSGYSSGHRLGLLARKPAPIVATGLGFITPTALPTVDYAILDESMVSEADAVAGLVPEQIIRIPTNMYYRPDPVLPLQRPERAGVVFGSANSLFKVNQAVIRCWATILRLVPDAVLSLRAKSLSDPDVLAIVRRRFEAGGVDPARILGAGQASRREFMEWYNSVDICLDPFPYQGGVTTSEALYMGCPVIACDAQGVNTTTSILRAADLGEYVADTPEDYVRLAVHFGVLVASLGPDQRLAIRRHIRSQIEGSFVFDADHFARKMEAAYEMMIAGAVPGKEV